MLTKRLQNSRHEFQKMKFQKMHEGKRYLEKETYELKELSRLKKMWKRRS